MNASFKAVLADFNSSKNLSDVTEMQSLMNNYKLLIEQISANDEKVKEVSIILAISGTKKQREEILKEIKTNAELYQIKVDIPNLRQMVAWQGFELTDKGLPDYAMYLPTSTLASAFFFTENYHNDSAGWLIGEDSNYGLPTFFDQFALTKNRTGHNMSVIGTTGSGKSFLLKLLITNEFARGTKLFLFDIENELEKLEQKLQEMNHKYNILEKTERYLIQAKERFSSHYLNNMTQGFEKYLNTINNEKMDTNIDVKLNVKIQEYGEKKEIEYLSTGYKDIIGICMRLALIEALFEKEKPFIILDDPFVNLDEEKIEKAKQIVQELSKTHQVIYFICHKCRE